MGWKMVRDNHQEILKDQISGSWRISPDPVGSLVRKLGEEYGEFAENRDPGELHDLWDVLEELTALLDPDGRTAARHQVKLDRMGGFGAHLEWHPNPDLDLWAAWGEDDAIPG